MLEEIAINKSELGSDEGIDKKILQLSLLKPGKYVTARAGIRNVAFCYHDRKPTWNSPYAEQTYRHYGGFWKNGKIIKPSNTFMKKFNFCPVS